MQHPSTEPAAADDPAGESSTPGHRSGHGAESSREQMHRDEQRRKNPESSRPDSRKPRPGALPVPGRAPAE